jgi:predicted peptidase
MTTYAMYFVGVLLMFHPQGTITLEPGKQLPQTVLVRIQDSSDQDDGGVREYSLHYLLFTPREYASGNTQWPLLLFLHGLGECGVNELERVKIHGPAKLVESRPDFPFVVVAPQCAPPPGGLSAVPTAWQTEPLVALIDHVMANMRIDPTRVYVTGLSMGGYGTWRLLAAHPERFAAAVPICGGGEPRAMAGSLRRVPIWAFHGARDAVVPVSESRQMVDAVCRAGGCANLTVYPEAEHDSWTQTYDNEQIYDWLLSHRGPLP